MKNTLLKRTTGKLLKIFIIVVTYNAEKWIDKCFGSFAVLPEGWKIAAIDNGSRDNTVNILKEKYPFVKVISNNTNLGFGKANNIGLKIALDENFDFALLLNQDAYISVNGIKKLADIAAENSSSYIVSPLHYNGDGTNFDKTFTPHLNKNNSPLLFDLSKNSFNPLYDVDGINAAAWLMSKKCLSEIGGFNPSFFHYGEDDNYIDRVKYHGEKISVSPMAAAYHDREGNLHTGKLFERRYVRARNRLYSLSDPRSKTTFRMIRRYCLAHIKILKFKEAFSFYGVIKNKIISRKKGPSFL